MSAQRGGYKVAGIDMQLEVCVECQTPFLMRRDIYQTAMARREKFTFYCPHGHAQHYITGESKEDKLRRERDQLTQRLAEWQDAHREERERAEKAARRAAAAKGQITRLKKRAAAGVCPCCNRQFTDLQRHMSSKHPGFIQEPDATEHVH